MLGQENTPLNAWNTVDERNPADQLRLVVFSQNLQGILYVPGGDRRISEPFYVFEGEGKSKKLQAFISKEHPWKRTNDNGKF